MTDSDRLAALKEKWQFSFDLPRSALWGEGDVKWLIAEVELLQSENADLEAAWRDAEDRCLSNTQVIARLKGLLYKLRNADPPSEALIVAVDEALQDPDIP